MAQTIVPKSQCIYGRCKMTNLCKGDHCVGAALASQGYKIENGYMTQEEIDKAPGIIK